MFRLGGAVSMFYIFPQVILIHLFQKMFLFKNKKEEAEYAHLYFQILFNFNIIYIKADKDLLHYS